MLKTPTQMVKQQALYDCYIACMCMVLGITYEEITQRLGSEFVARVQAHSCQGDDVQKLYASLGLVAGRDYKRVYRHMFGENTAHYGSSAEFAREILWGRRALIQLKSLNVEGQFHMVFWDGFEMFDPSNLQLHHWDTCEPMGIIIFNERPQAGPARVPTIEDADDAS